MYNFPRKYLVLSLRKPEPTSLGRATSFNRQNVAEVFNNYKKALEKYKFTPDRIWNLDETGCTTVQKPSRIIAAAGAKKVGAIVTALPGGWAIQINDKENNAICSADIPIKTKVHIMNKTISILATSILAIWVFPTIFNVRHDIYFEIQSSSCSEVTRPRYRSGGNILIH